MLEVQTRLLYNNLRPSSMGHLGLSSIVKNSAPLFSGLRMLGTYCLIYVLEGEAQYEDASERRFSLAPGNLIICFPEIAHRIEPPIGRTWSEFYITFQGPVFDLWRREKLLNPEKPVHFLPLIEYWLGRFESLLLSVPSDTTDPLVAACALQQLLAEALSFEGQPVTSQMEQAWLGRIQERLKAVTRADELDLQAIAAENYMSYASFRQKFVRLAGVPPGRYHMTHLVQYACKLMCEESLTNKELADRCGFCNEYYFSQRFKQVIGMTTRDFRRGFHGVSRLAPVSGQVVSNTE